jgi:hypothetical protein
VKNEIQTNAAPQLHSELQPTVRREEILAAANNAKEMMLDHASEDD